MKVYNGHSRIFYLHIEKPELLEGLNNKPTQAVLFDMIKDQKDHMSPYIHGEIAKWCLANIKESQEKTPAKVTWYEDIMREITS